MQVDSLRFLPRSFSAFYANAEPIEGERDPVWAEFEPRLTDARIGMVTSAGLHLKDGQDPFDVDRERQDPSWGDPTYRFLPAPLATADIGMTHLHVNPADVLADHNVALPTDALAELVNEGMVGSQTAQHASVMGYQQAGLQVWRNETAPEIIAMLQTEGANGVVLAPV